MCTHTHAHTNTHTHIFVQAADKIKAEIMARGPVSCGMHVSPQFVAYRGGIFKQVCVWLGVTVCMCVNVCFSIRGPVSCGMHVSPQCVASRGGIFKQVCVCVWVSQCVCVCVCMCGGPCHTVCTSRLNLSHIACPQKSH